MTYKDIQGWFDYAWLYDQVVSQYPTGHFVEIGAWKGRSTAYIASQLRPGQHLFVVDHFQGDGRRVHQSMLEALDKPLIETFRDNMLACGVLDRINLLAMPSVEAASHIEDGSLQFCWIDAGHQYDEVVADYGAWLPKMAPGGLIAGHDYERGNQVAKAIDDLIPSTHRQIKGNVWMREV